MRRRLLPLALALVALVLVAAAIAWRGARREPAPTSPVARLYDAMCSDCHGADGRGSWRAVFFLIRPGDLGAAARRESDQYLFEIIRDGGSPLGRPGMPAFGGNLSEADVRALVAYIKTLGIRRNNS